MQYLTTVSALRKTLEELAGQLPFHLKILFFLSEHPEVIYIGGPLFGFCVLPLFHKTYGRSRGGLWTEYGMIAVQFCLMALTGLFSFGWLLDLIIE